jgi:PIN domain nuclease of toxin-antitoxin system
VKLVLDACTLVWLASSPDQLSDVVASAVNDVATDLFLSDGSVWEICLKWGAGKLQLPKPPRLWIEEQRRAWNIDAVPIERNHLYRVSELPAHHRDPFDRLLVAQAIENGLTIATPDPLIVLYPAAVLW